MRTKRLFLIGAGALALALPAQAHELRCEKAVNDVAWLELGEFPATLTWTLDTINIHESLPSTVLSAEDPLLAQSGWSHEPEVPYEIPFASEVRNTYTMELADLDACWRFAALDGYDDGIVDNTFTVSWDNDQSSCSARIVCAGPPTGNGCEGATRTIGFWRTHPDATEQCLVGGAIPLGFISVDTLAEALGILWASPNAFDDGSARDDLDRRRILLGKQLLAATCNSRMFGSEPLGTVTLESARDAAAGNDCALISDSQSVLDAFNNGGDDHECPAFVHGPAEPRDAQALAEDTTVATDEVCRE